MKLFRLCSIVLLVGLLEFQTTLPMAFAQQSGASTVKDIGWPREINRNGARLIYYQPQIDDWKDYRELSGRVAVSLTPKGGQPVLGVASVKASTISDVQARTVFIQHIELPDARFPAADDDTTAQLTRLLREMFPTEAITISLDRVIASVERGKHAGQPVAIKTDPPQIFFSKKSAILLLVEGEPVRSPIEKTKLEFVVNTNWDLFFDQSKKQYYLLYQQTWLTAGDLHGPWTVTRSLPSDMAKLPARENWDDVKKAVPAPVTSYSPQVFFSDAPAELITSRGDPVYARIPNTRLLYTTNTDSDVFLHIDESQYYFLVSGRWFRAKQLEGPWTYAGNDLPRDFANIPSSSPKAYVKASVPGTQEASDAVMLAQVPTTAVVNRAEAEAKVKVTYIGDPQFKPIEGTNLEYAVNSQEKIIKYGDLYYLCFQGIWFRSTAPQGPWKTADSVPKEIYSIPPSSPVYNVTYVVVSNPTPTTVESSYTSGYTGMFVAGFALGAVVMWGSGYYYPPYYYYGRLYPYPVYWGWPHTYGVHAVWNPYYGGYHVGHYAYGPYAAVGSSAWYNPATGRYGRSATVQTAYRGRTVAHAYNPWTGAYGATRQGHNPYAQWGSSVAVRGDDWIRTGHVSTGRGTVAGIKTSEGNRAVIARGSQGTIAAGNNNIYAGHDGNVYKRDSSGDWHKYEKGGGWNQVETPGRPTPANDSVRNSMTKSGRSGSSIESRQRASAQPATMQGLNQEAWSRSHGAQQTRQFENAQRGGYRTGGGFSRGGGRVGGGRRR